MHLQRTTIGRTSFILMLALAGCPGEKPGNPGDTAPESSGTGTTVGSGGESSGGDTWGGDCAQNDVWEPNPSADAPSMVSWQTEEKAWFAGTGLDAYLCAGESDWYHFDVKKLGYTVHNLQLRVRIKDAGFCGVICEEPVIPAGPEHAMTIEIFRADTMELVGSLSEDDGVLKLDGSGDNFAHDLLFHVSSPTPSAAYPYHLSLTLVNFDGEDECEC